MWMDTHRVESNLFALTLTTTSEMGNWYYQLRFSVGRDSLKELLVQLRTNKYFSRRANRFFQPGFEAEFGLEDYSDRFQVQS